MTNWNWVKFGVGFLLGFSTVFTPKNLYYPGVWTLNVWERLGGIVSSRMWIVFLIRSDQGGHSSLKVLENSFPFFRALESLWRQFWCLKVLEFCIRGPWKCLNSETLHNPRCVEKWCGHWSNTVNVSVTYWLDAVKAVSYAENCGGIGLEKGREGAWMSLILFPPKQWPPCVTGCWSWDQWK